MAEIHGVVGYGNQGRAQAQNLRDHGIDVRIGVRPGGASEGRARADGFVPETPETVAKAAAVLALLVPDEVLPELGTALGPHLDEGGMVVLAHGSALAFGDLAFPRGRDVVLVAPSAPGTELRGARTPVEGVGAILAVHEDATGRARERALDYAVACGCDAARVIWASVEEEAVVDLFGEQVVLCGGLAELVGQAFDTLVDAGYPPELAHLECVTQLRLTTALISGHGIDGMWDRVSGTARYGGLEAGPRVVGEASAKEMRTVLERIRSGAFFRDFLADHTTGGARMRAMRRAARRDRLEKASKRGSG